MKIIDAHSHIGHFGSWARFDFEKTLLTGAGFHDNKSVIDAFQKEPDLIAPVAWVKPGGAVELTEFAGKTIVALLPDTDERYLSTWLFE